MSRARSSSGLTPVADTTHATAATPMIEPDTEHIRSKAHDIYAQRMHQGAPGDALSDWLSAERQLRAQSAPGRPAHARQDGR